jgi:predicted methyltransferase
LEENKLIKAKYITKVTDINKVILENVLKEGDIVVDATVGNGYDTKYLAEQVGESGFVYGFDIQQVAIYSSTKLLEKNNLLNRTKLILDGHENIDNYIDKEISCVLFNLGYLPRADHSVITKPNTTIQAIEKSLKLLKPHGIISIALYTGHEGGIEEKNLVYEYIMNLDQTYFNVLRCDFMNQKNNPPQLLLIEKKKEY